MRPLLSSVVCLLSSIGWIDCAAAWPESCKFSADRKLELQSGGLIELEIVARGGDLKLQSSSSSGVAASGRACASSAELLERTQIRGTRDGTKARVFVQVPDDVGDLDSAYATLDLVIEVPAGVSVQITDTSGDIDAQGVRLARITDSSGDIETRGTSGDLEVSDSSGDLHLSDVEGAVTISDSSGDVTVDTAQSLRVLRDSSGDLRIVGIKGDVVVDNDSSGDIHVDRIGGNVEVVSDSSGERSIEHVVGSIREPEQ
jgi:hypothetical protein